MTATVSAAARALAPAPLPAASAMTRSRTVPVPVGAEASTRCTAIRARSVARAAKPRCAPSHGSGSSAPAWRWKARRRRPAFVRCSAWQRGQASRCANARSASSSLVASPSLQRADRHGPVPAQAARVVEELEALALSLARAHSVARLVDRDAEQRADAPVAHALRQQHEDPLLGIRELGEELGDDQSVLARERGVLWCVLVGPRLCPELDLRRALREDLAATALIAVKVQRAMLEPLSQRVSQVLLVVVGAGDECERGLLVEILELLAAETPALGEAAGDADLAGLPFAKQLSGAREAELARNGSTSGGRLPIGAAGPPALWLSRTNSHVGCP